MNVRILLRRVAALDRGLDSDHLLLIANLLGELFMFISCCHQFLVGFWVVSFNGLFYFVLCFFGDIFFSLEKKVYSIC